jgi:sulfide:quinone oxidoreductase
MAHRVVILGGGFGGVAAATRLRSLLPADDEIVLVDRRDYFMMGFRKTGEVVGAEPMADGRRPLEALTRVGIEVIQGEITAIDPQARGVEVDGRRVAGDALLVALGARTVPDAVPGLREHGIDIYDPDEVPRAAAALRDLAGGSVVIGIFGAPYRCAPAPYELALLAAEAAGKRNATMQFTVFTPQPMSVPVLGQVGCGGIEDRLSGAGIDFRPATKATRVESGAVVVDGGADIPFDLLLAVPPHRIPKVVEDAGLAGPSGWVRADARTLETAFPDVYAVGDITGIPMANGQPLPKAGVLAAAQGEVVAERIAARLGGGEPTATFDGEGYCFLEIGGGQAMLVRGNFLTEPAPAVELTAPSEEFLVEKQTFERERLDAWFGPV